METVRWVAAPDLLALEHVLEQWLPGHAAHQWPCLKTGRLVHPSPVCPVARDKHGDVLMATLTQLLDCPASCTSCLPAFGPGGFVVRVLTQMYSPALAAYCLPADAGSAEVGRAVLAAAPTQALTGRDVLVLIEALRERHRVDPSQPGPGDPLVLVRRPAGGLVGGPVAQAAAAGVHLSSGLSLVTADAPAGEDESVVSALPGVTWAPGAFAALVEIFEVLYADDPDRGWREAGRLWQAAARLV